ncbi:septin-11-like, partial [Pecten maximus]|uniref:septin-11-like n=1 Tax=Pecten maximus TaxID=6579 RepID=UPI0014581FC2
MIEQSLISVNDSKSIQKKETEDQQAEDLLYIVFSKSQEYIDSFIAILNKNGYDFIVKTLLEDPADQAPKDPQANASESEYEKVLKKCFSEMKADLQKQQDENAQKQVELMEQHKSELKEDFKAELADLKQTEEQREKNEEKIKSLETQVNALEKKLDEERAKKDGRRSGKRIKELEKERDELKAALTKVKHDNFYLRNVVNDVQDKKQTN